MRLVSLICFLHIITLSSMHAQLKLNYKTEYLFHDTLLYNIYDNPRIQHVKIAGKDVLFHAYYKHSQILHAVFLKKDDFFYFEEYTYDGDVCARGKLVTNPKYCKKDTQHIFSPITLKEIENTITCYYALVKVGQWEYINEQTTLSGSYFNGKKEGIWKKTIGNNLVSNIYSYKSDSLYKDSSIANIQNYQNDSLYNILHGVWFASRMSKQGDTYILERENREFTFDYSLKFKNDFSFERNNKFLIDKHPHNHNEGTWSWNNDKTLSLITAEEKTTYQILYIDKKRIIVQKIIYQKI